MRIWSRGGKTPILDASELGELGYKIVVFPLAGLFAATRAVESCYSYLLKHGTTAGFGAMLTFKDFERIIDVPKYREIERKFKIRESE